MSISRTNVWQGPEKRPASSVSAAWIFSRGRKGGQHHEHQPHDRVAGAGKEASIMSISRMDL